MSIKTPDAAPAADPNTAPQPSRSRRLIASLAATALTGGIVAGGAAVYKERSGSDTHRDSPSIGQHETPPTKTPEKTPPAGPVHVEQLPGYGKRVSPEQRKALQASTVQVVRLKPDPTTGFSKESICNGIKVELNGNTYVATARHCLVDKGLDTITEFPRLNTSPDPAHDPSLHNPKTVSESLSGKVSIWTIGANGLADTRHAIPVDRVAASYYPDMALLRVVDASPNADKFNAVPAINYEAAMSAEPVAGAQAVLFNNELGTKVAETTGIFLGISANPADRAQNLAWVLVDHSSANTDGCYYGKSGSASMVAGAGVTGPLAVRLQPGDFAGGIPQQRVKHWRDTVAADLGVSLEGHNTTLCGFSEVTPDSIQAMAQVVDGQ